MEQKICDRCGSVIKRRKLFKLTNDFEVALEQEFRWYGRSRKKYDLCYDCTIALRKFMNDDIAKTELDVPREVVYEAYAALVERNDIDEATGILGEVLDA